MTFSTLPRIIQGGMGVAVSDWRLANAVARAGQLGVVSGTLLDTVMVRRLQDGDRGGHLRRAIAEFPIPGVGEEILRRYFNPSGRAPGVPYKLLPMYKQSVSVARQRVTVLANFVEIWLAKEGHSSPIGLNLLTKIQLPNMPSLYGAMLAGVAVVIMGAGIPREMRARIFEAGFSTKESGWGIGLPLAKRIAEENHRGRLILTPSEKGATFDIILQG